LSKWDRILPEKVYSTEEPDEFVVDFVGFLRKRNRPIVLDLACGAGRHAIYMAEQGLEVNGADISATGLKMTKERLRKRGLEAALVKSAMNYLPYLDSCFDAVICTRAIYHQKLAAIQKTLLETRRVLRKNGTVLIDFLSRRTYSFGKGDKIEENTFVETEGHEKEVIHHFADKKELRRLLDDFEILSIESHEKEVEGKLRSRLIVQAMK
jgi:ubiquinone/menaquinone biosynthesis C-methylase UbiE